MVRFIHLSDTHIAADRTFTNYGHAPYANLNNLVELINALPDDYDFILHSGDVAEDGTEEAYQSARGLLQRLKKPVYYLVGNHDKAVPMQRSLLNIARPAERYDQTFVCGGYRFILLDSSGPVDPGGTLTTQQLNWLEDFCKSGEELVIALHHQPLKLGVHWLDEHIFTDNGGAMYLQNYPDFQRVIAPARDRIRGVFFGHIHRALQMVHQGVLYSSAPSTFGQLDSWPTLAFPKAAAHEAPGYCLVTIGENGTQVQQYSFARPS